MIIVDNAIVLFSLNQLELSLNIEGKATVKKMLVESMQQFDTFKRDIICGTNDDQDISDIFNIWLLPVLLLFVIYCLPVSSWIKRAWQYCIVSRVSHEEYPDLTLPPGTMGYPLIGETLDFLKNRGEFYRSRMEKHGNIYKTHLLGRPTIRVIGAENIRRVLVGENRLVTPNWPTSTRLLLGTGAVTQALGYIHKVRRKYIKHALGNDTLQSMIPLVQEGVRSCLKDWEERKDFFMYPACNLMAFTITASSLVGLDVNVSRQSGMEKTFRDFLANLMTVPFDIPGFGFHKGLKAKNKLMNDLREVLKAEKKLDHIPAMKSYFDSYIQDDENSEQEALEGVIDLLFAGHVNISSLTTNCCMFLGLHPEIRDKLRNEIIDRIGDNKNKDLNFVTVNNMPYLHAVVKEVLRLCPPVGGGFRKAEQDFELGGYLVPKGWSIVYSIRETHHTSPIYKDGDHFNPDRWIEMDKQIQTDGHDFTRFHYLPFGFGARGCIGKTYAQMVVKIFLIQLVQDYTWTLKNTDIQMTYIPTPVSTDDLPVTFSRRKDSS